jgi:DNA repair protein RecO (recombination protein O)
MVPRMDWQDEGILLSARPHGESAAIAEVFARGHGRHAGVVRGGASRRTAPLLQPGAQLAVVWRARLAEHLGAFTMEPLRSRAVLMDDPARLAVLAAACAMLRATLPEREAHPALWAETVALFDALAEGRAGAPAYLPWEMRLLADLGFGLDLSACAVTGAREGLAFVSPRTGRAVSRAGAGDWAGRLMPLPEAVRTGMATDAADVLAGLAITGHFLARETAAMRNGAPLPEARARLLARIARG